LKGVIRDGETGKRGTGIRLLSLWTIGTQRVKVSRKRNILIKNVYSYDRHYIFMSRVLYNSATYKYKCFVQKFNYIHLSKQFN